MQKRSAQTELNADNWDQPDEYVEKEEFTKADVSTISSRTILSARRSSVKSGTGGVLNNFTGFTSFPSVNNSHLFNFPKSDKDKNESTTTVDSSATEDSTRLSQIKALNESVLSWITKYVKVDPYCVLSPVFKDYAKHLSKIEGTTSQDDDSKGDSDKSTQKSDATQKAALSSFSFKFSGSTSSSAESNAPSESKSEDENKKSNPEPNKSLTSSGLLSFASYSSTPTNPSSKNDALPTPTFQFGFGKKPISDSQAKQPSFSFGLPSLSTNQSSSVSKTLSAPVSLFTPNSLLQSNGSKEKTDQAEAEEDEDYVPPVPETREIKEDGSVYTTRCKLFYKSGDSWKDRGLGNLFIKPDSDDKDKFQLLVRADTTLGNILLNINVTKDIPIKQQKNNLTFICVPNPPISGLNAESKGSDSNSDGKPRFVPMLLRVKTEEAASRLLDEINKHRNFVE